VESIKLLIAASKFMPEEIIRKNLARLMNFDAEEVLYIDNGAAIKKVALHIWPNATAVTLGQSITSYRKAIAGCSHLVFLWDGDDLSRLLFEAKSRNKKVNLITVNVTRVVNKKETTDYDVYIGRGTPWGNPFAISYEDGPDRDDVIEKYRSFFDKKIAEDENFKKGVLAMRGLRLACFCKPSPCHGDVIAGYLNNYADDPVDGA
jgi:hypothetical protein